MDWVPGDVRLAYRNFGDHESLVCPTRLRPEGRRRALVRDRNPAAPVRYQQSTVVDPD